MSTTSLKKNKIYLKALGKLEQGDYINGIDWIYRSISRDFDPDQRIELAIAYYNIGQYNYALKELFIVFWEIGDDYEVLKYMIHCYIEMGQIESAIFYIKYCLDKDIFDDEDLELEDFDFTARPRIKVTDSRDKSAELQLAHKMIVAEQLELAEELLKSIEKQSYQYADARNFLAMLAIASEKPDEALAFCDEALESSPNNIMALSQKFTALNLLKRIKERDEVIEQLESIKTKDVTDLAKIAVSFKMIGRDDLTAEYFEKIITQLPYDRDYLICTAEAQYNCENYDRAKQIIVTALKLYPFDATIEYYAMEIQKRTFADKFDVLPVIPASESEIWIAELAKLPNLGFSVAEKIIRSDKMFDLKIRWAFQSDIYILQESLAHLLIGIKKYQKLLKEYLLDPFSNLRVKREIVGLYMMTNPMFKEVFLAVNDGIISMSPRIPIEIRNHELFPAYCKAFSFLMIIEKNFVTKLNKAFTLMITSGKDIGERKRPRYNTIAAVLVKKVEGKRMSDEDCCEYMECDMTNFTVFKELIYGK